VQKSAFLEYLSQKYPDYAYSIRSPGGTHYVMVSLSVLFLLIITYFIAIFRSGSDVILLLILFFFLLERPSLKKTEGCIVSNHIGMKFGRIVLK